MKRLSDYDADQIVKYLYDEDNNAQRVTLVGMDNLTIEPKIDLSFLTDQLNRRSSENVKIERIEVPVIVKETVLEKIEIPTVIKETIIERIEIPVVIKEIEYREIDKPLIVYKPIAVERQKENKVLNVFKVIQALSLFGILIKMLFLK